MWENFSQLSEMGLPSPFLEDGSIATVEKITEKIKEKEQDPTIFQSFGHPPTMVDIESVIHPLAQLLFYCEAGASLFEVLPYKETLNLGGVQENLWNIEKPSKDEWPPLQETLSKL